MSNIISIITKDLGLAVSNGVEIHINGNLTDTSYTVIATVYMLNEGVRINNHDGSHIGVNIDITEDWHNAESHTDRIDAILTKVGITRA